MTKVYFAVAEHEPSFETYRYGKILNQSKDYVNRLGKYMQLNSRIYLYVLTHLLGLSRTALFSAVSESLERLETDYIDVLWIHRFDPETPIEETMRALHDLVVSGKLRYLGASSMW